MSQDYIKNILKKKGVYTAKREGNYVYVELFTFTSVVQILDYVDKNHMNTHYFRCSDLNKLMIIIIIIIIVIIIIIIIKHYTSFSVASVNK